MLRARHRELRRLDVGGVECVLSYPLESSLAGCVRLESLSLYRMDGVIDYLPPGGLPALRHLSLANCELRDEELGLLVERQPDLETIHLSFSSGLSQNGLVPLCRLSALRSLTLENVPGVSDWLLEQLSKAPLTELTLGGGYGFQWSHLEFWKSITGESLVRLARSRPALRWATLWDECSPAEPKLTIDCQTEVGKQELIRICEEYRTKALYYVHCRLGGAPADNL